MDEILTNDELDALLTAISTTSLEKSDDAPVEPKKIRTYDFKKPDKFSKDHLKSFQYIFETFSRIASPALSLKFEIPLSINFSSIDQLSYEEFSKLIPENSILGMVNLKPLHGYTIFEFEPEFTFSLIDILTGGKGDPIIKPRQLTDLELSIIQTIMHTLVSYLKESFQSVLQIKPVLEKIETNTFFKQKLYSGEIVLQVCLDLNLKGTEYSMNICLPYTSLEPVIHKFSNKILDYIDDSNKDNSQYERRKKILESCMIRTYSEFQAGTVYIQPNGETEDISHEVNINLTHDSKSSHYFKTLFKNFIRSAEVL